TDDTAVRSGNPDRAAVVAAHRAEAETRRDGRGRTGRRSARDVLEVPRIAHRPEASRGAGAGERHLVEVELAQEYGARRLQPPPRRECPVTVPSPRRAQGLRPRMQ